MEGAGEPGLSPLPHRLMPQPVSAPVEQLVFHTVQILRDSLSVATTDLELGRYGWWELLPYLTTQLSLV